MKQLSIACLGRNVPALFAVFLAYPVFLAAGVVSTPPRIESIAVEPGTLRLRWTPGAASYALQGTADLNNPSWRPVLTTTRTEAVVRRTADIAFYRLVNLDSPPVTSVTDVDRLRVLDAINAFMLGLNGEDGLADSRVVVQYLAQFPELEAVGSLPDTSVYARFRDGRSLVILNNRPPATAEELEPSPALSTSARGPEGADLQDTHIFPAATLAEPFGIVASAPVAGLPASRRAVLFKATLPAIASPMLDQLAPAFTTRGYTVSGGEADVPNLMAVRELGSDIGVFYIDSHGGFVIGRAEFTDTNSGAQYVFEFPIFVVATSTVVTSAHEGIYKDLLDRNALTYTLMGPATRKGLVRETNAPPPVSYYCITSIFARDFWQFGHNSLVYIDTCHGASADAEPFRTACFARGAAMYGGWTRPVHDATAYRTTRLLFDDLLGGGKIFDVQPRQRPFDFASVTTYLRATGLDTEARPNFGGRLVWSPGPAGNGAFGLLAPSIQNMFVDEVSGVLRIFGLFDPNSPATVRLEGNGSAESTLTPLSRTEVDFPLAAGEQPSAGNVTVVQGQRPSNTVPLTEWWVQGQLRKDFAVDQPEPSATFDFVFHFRTDLHRYRRTPHEVPVFLNNSAQPAKDSIAFLSNASGIYHDPNGIRTVEWRLDSLVGLPLVFPPLDQNGTWFTGGLNVLATDAFYLTFNARAREGVTSIERTISSTTGEPVEFVTRIDVAHRNFSVTGQNGTFDRSSYSILAGEGPGAGDSGLIRWETAGAMFPASESIPGYAE